MNKADKTVLICATDYRGLCIVTWQGWNMKIVDWIGVNSM